MNYIHLTWGPGNYYVRYDSGMVFQGILNSGQMEDKLLYDFTLNVGDTLHDYYYPSSNTDYIVTLKEKRLVHQDSLWYMELYLDQWTNLAWLEGVGELKWGFIPKFGIEESNNHICTQNSINQTIAENEDLFSSEGYDCDFIHGFDLDEDGFRSDFDCDDANSEIYPEAEEIPNNDIDEDCNGEDLVVLIPCMADAGRDTVVCVSTLETDTFYLGGQPVVTEGQPPFLFKWSTFYQEDEFVFYASDFLSDTTVSNPAIVYPFDHPLTFHLEVTDSEGTTCSDSVRVGFSQYTWTLDVKERAIMQGDSVQLYISIYGGIAPLSYHWSPEAGLTNPTDPFTWASPDTTTIYELTVTDSAGCIGLDNFSVIVLPTSVDETADGMITITLYSNPLNSQSLLKVNGPVMMPYRAHIYNTYGQSIQSYDLVNNEVVLQRRDFSPGLYFYQVRSGGSIVGVGKIVVE
ncbi:MAG TPA: MopE-related protein [Saprospiraceae bacterium]|nr:MopE-related protein [Saprospiraceae bacterium]